MPPVTSCVYDQPRAKFHCIDFGGTAFDLSYDDPKADKLIAIPYEDFGTLLNYCKGLKGKWVAIIYMVEDLFKIKDLDKKEAQVRAHYNAAYRVQLKENLEPHEIEKLFQELQKLRGTAFIYHKSH